MNAKMAALSGSATIYKLIGEEKINVDNTYENTPRLPDMMARTKRMSPLESVAREKMATEVNCLSDPKENASNMRQRP
ncbi:hypothetical protein [Devriesea agamarum]|uniref:hypothetical protein n=1 Tax=Devriesea agamarum TaxID=472569 RepID=UPI00071CA2B1|nr:hypothetical protein [Devriesea agamarum]